jgi:prefoldin subunit 5
MIDVKVIEERKETLQGDIEKLEQSITQVGEQQRQLQANLFAVQGALQQCNMFLEMLNEEEKTNE